MIRSKILWAGTLLLLAGCSSDEGEAETDGDGGINLGPGTTISVDGGSGGSAGSQGSGGPQPLPSDFTATDNGGYKLGPTLDGSGSGGGTGDGRTDECGNILAGVVRDFTSSHEDFEAELGEDRGIVAEQLGSDLKPVYAGGAGTATTHGAAAFEEWYRSVEDVNEAFELYLHLEPNAGVFTFESNSFFPLDDAGFGNQGNDHNFHFTSEFHTEFRYNGGELFRFTGDDDVFVFVNGRLALDLGGVHVVQEAEIDLDVMADELGIEVGGVYPLDLFHAERHTSLSNFRIDTTLDFVSCSIPVSVR